MSRWVDDPSGYAANGSVPIRLKVCGQKFRTRDHIIVDKSDDFTGGFVDSYIASVG